MADMSGMMNAEVGGLPFSEIMNQAVKLKTHQAKPDRRRWDSWPKHKQNTMFGRDDVKEAREAPFEARFAAAMALKGKADAFFRARELLDASLNYEYALACFRWLSNIDPGWKKKGILDSDIVEHEYLTASTPASERASVTNLYVACYLNLARVYHKSGDTATALSACDYALAVDDQCDKALLLRAQVRLSKASAGATEQDMSIKDAAAAQKLLASKLARSDATIAALKADSSATLEAEEDGAFDMDRAVTPEAEAEAAARLAGLSAGGKGSGAVSEARRAEAEKEELAKRQRETTKYLAALRKDQAEQRDKDKQWGGVFKRGEIYDKEAEAAAAPAGGGVHRSIYEQLDDARRLLQVYESRGQDEEADNVRDEIKKCTERIAAHEAQRKAAQSGDMVAIDFDNPTEEMKRDALEKGIDLDNAAVRELLKRLQATHQASGEPMTDESIGRAMDAENEKETAELKAKVRPIIEEMGLPELREALKALGIPITAPSPDGKGRASRLGHAELVEAMVGAVVAKAEAGEPLPKLPAPRGSPVGRAASAAAAFFRAPINLLFGKPAAAALDADADSPAARKAAVEAAEKRTFRITFAAAACFFIGRLYWSGHLRLLVQSLREGSQAHEEDPGAADSEYDEF